MFARLLGRLRGRPAAGPVAGWLDASEVAWLHGTEARPAIIDVRGADEFTGPLGHIDGAVNLPLDRLEARADSFDAPRDRDIVLVCLTDKRSARAAAILAERGFERVVVLQGGMKGWNAAGLPVSRDV